MVNLVSFNKLLNAYYRRRESVSCIPFFLPPFLPRSLRVYNYFSVLSFLHSRRFRSILYAYVYIQYIYTWMYVHNVLYASAVCWRISTQENDARCSYDLRCARKSESQHPFLSFLSCLFHLHARLSLSLSLLFPLSHSLRILPLSRSRYAFPSPLPSFLPLSFLWFGSARIYFLISYPIVFLFVRFRMIQGQFLTFTY